MPKTKAKNRVSKTSTDRLRQLIAKRKSNMQVIEARPTSEDAAISADARVPDLAAIKRKYGATSENSDVSAGTGFRATQNSSPKELHMIPVQPKNAVDEGTPRRRTIVVDEDAKIVGESG